MTTEQSQRRFFVAVAKILGGLGLLTTLTIVMDDYFPLLMPILGIVIIVCIALGAVKGGAWDLITGFPDHLKRAAEAVADKKEGQYVIPGT